MARPKLPLPEASAIMALADAEGRLAIRVTPNASADAVIMPAPGDTQALTVRTTAAPEDGKANLAVLRMVAGALGRPVSALELVRGATGRNKLIRILPLTVCR